MRSVPQERRSVRRRGRGAAGATGWPTPPSPCPSCARRCRTWALWRAAATRGSPASICCRTWGPAGTRRFRWPRCWTWASAAGTALYLRAEPRGRGDAAARAGAHGPEGKEHMAKLSVRDDRPVGAQHGAGLQRAQQQQQRAGRRGRGLLLGLRLRGAWCGTSSTPGGC